jgi:hypothetical protein
MAKNLFDSTVRTEMIRRVGALRPDAQPGWGKMNIEQMLCHCIDSLKITFAEKGEVIMPTGFLTTGLAHWFVISLPIPIPKNAPSHPLYFEQKSELFERDGQLLIGYLERFAKGREQKFGIHPAFGKLSPEQSARLQYRHIDHHLRQFGV